MKKVLSMVLTFLLAVQLVLPQKIQNLRILPHHPPRKHPISPIQQSLLIRSLLHVLPTIIFPPKMFPSQKERKPIGIYFPAKRVFPYRLQITLSAAHAEINAKLSCSTPLKTSGKCGEKLRWNVDSHGTLTISGTGEMDSYTSTSAPWQTLNITKAVLQNGVTSVGNYAFKQCSDLISVNAPLCLRSPCPAEFPPLPPLASRNPDCGKSLFQTM